MNYLQKLLILFASILISQSCTYNNLEDLRPQPSSCDTLNINFSNDIQTIFNDNCIVCHNGPTPPAGFNFENYENIVSVAETGRLLGAIKHLEGYSPMPKNANQLDSCSIIKIEAWINANYPKK
jgi:hypothetical protein